MDYLREVVYESELRLNKSPGLTQFIEFDWDFLFANKRIKNTLEYRRYFLLCAYR